MIDFSFFPQAKLKQEVITAQNQPSCKNDLNGHWQEIGCDSTLMAIT